MALISVFSRRHPPTSLAGSESAHFDPGRVCGSSLSPKETHQWENLPLHRLPRWRKRCMSGRKEQLAGRSQAGLPSALSSGKELKEDYR